MSAWDNTWANSAGYGLVVVVVVVVVLVVVLVLVLVLVVVVVVVVLWVFVLAGARCDGPPPPEVWDGLGGFEVWGCYFNLQETCWQFFLFKKWPSWDGGNRFFFGNW